MTTANESCKPGCATGCSIGLPSSETSDAPISDQWPDWWTSSLRDSRANLIASPEPGLERLTTATSGRTRSEPLGRWDPDLSCWKTCQASLLTGTAEPWSGSWPRSGMTVAGRLYPPRTLRHRTDATGGGAWRHWRTPAAHDGGGGGSRKWETLGPDRADLQLTLSTQVSWVEQGHIPAPMLPTPLVTDAPDHGGPPNKNTHNRQWGGANSLGQMAKQGLWPTPQYHDARPGHPERVLRKGPGGMRNLCDDVTMWPTPTVNGNHNRKGASPTSGDGLATAVTMFPTPVAADSDRTSDTYSGGNPTLLGAVNWPTPRASRTGGADSHGEMPEAFRGGLLNPRWVEWLQGIPIGWTETDELPQTNYTAWQTLSAMQDDLLPETETKREMGRDVQAPTLLRFQLCGICTWPEHARGRPETSAADDPANQLPMREYIQPSKAPHRRESSEQRGRQSGGALPEMSRGCPHEHRDMGSWWEVEPAIPRVIGGHPNRVNQVRTLGNGIVPAVVARFLRELMS